MEQERDRNEYVRRSSAAYAMNRRYVQTGRRSSGYRGSGPVHGGRNRRRNSGPPPLLVLLALVVLAALLALVLWLIFGRGEKATDDGAASASASSAVSSMEPADSLPEEAPDMGEPQQDPLTAPAEKDPGVEPEKWDSFLKVGDTGYEYYHFSETAAQKYISAVCSAGNALNGTATLYSMVVPSAMDIVLPESYIIGNEISSSDQRAALEYINNSIEYNTPAVVTVPLFDAFKLHNNEYIYFRTDRNWTQLGAYYAYEAFCKARGFDPVPLSDFDKHTYEGYLGSYYSATGSEDLGANPDTLDAYHSPFDTSMAFTQSDGEYVSGWPVIMDGSGYGSGMLYYIFAAAEQPYKELTNNDLDDGSACVVVQESFGNAFVPFLTSHYQTVYVVDYRFYTGDVAQLARDVGATDVILLNSITMTSSEEQVEHLADRF